MKNALIAGVIGFMFAAPVTASACGGYFSMCDQYGREQQLVVYAWGPGTTAQSPFNNYNQPSYNQPTYQPQQNYYQPTYQPYQPQQYYQPSYAYNQPTYYQPQYSYNQPSYNYYQPTYQENYYTPYSYPQYNSYNYYDQQPYFGYSAQPTGQQDFWGNNLCNWGDYQGYSCDRDPHQWIQDSATGEWY